MSAPIGFVAPTCEDKRAPQVIDTESKSWANLAIDVPLWRILCLDNRRRCAFWKWHC